MARDAARRDQRVSSQPATTPRAGARPAPLRLLDAVLSARGTRVDIAVVAAITALAAGLRFWHLGTVPLGLHGDEAWTGIDARRILHEGWIGVYVRSALGQPAGPLYVTALLFSFLPETTATARFSMALFGVATVPLAYLAFSSMFNRTVGAFSSLLLAVMMWHLHLSRTAFMVSAWPLTEVATIWLLWLALRRRRMWLFGAAGAVHGLGVYTYNADLLFLPVPFVAIAWSVFAEHGRARRLRLLSGAAVFAATALIVAAPLVDYAVRHWHTYQYHERIVSVTASQEWKDASILGKGGMVRRRADEWVRGIAVGGRPDLGDGLASDGHPLVDPLTLFLAAIGLGTVLWRWRRPESAVVVAVLVLLPWGALLTVEDGLFRRTLGLTPFIALLAALPLAWLWDGLWSIHDRWKPLFIVAVAGVVTLNGAWTVYQYFGPVQRTDTMRFVYPYQLDAASRFIAGLPPGTYIYFFSDRWRFDYETRRFLAPQATGEDRSKKFGATSPDDAYRIDTTGDVAFVFLGTYVDDVDKVREQHPGGTETEARRGDDVLFRAYVLTGR